MALSPAVIPAKFLLTFCVEFYIDFFDTLVVFFSSFWSNLFLQYPCSYRIFLLIPAVKLLLPSCTFAGVYIITYSLLSCWWLFHISLFLFLFLQFLPQFLLSCSVIACLIFELVFGFKMRLGNFSLKLFAVCTTVRLKSLQVWNISGKPHWKFWINNFQTENQYNSNISR